MALMAPMMLPSSVWAAARHGRRAVVFLAEYLAVWLAFAVLILMVALLAMGVMNVAWMLIPAAVALLEKSMPGYRSNAFFTARRHSLTRRSASSSSSRGS